MRRFLFLIISISLYAIPVTAADVTVILKKADGSPLENAAVALVPLYTDAPEKKRQTPVEIKQEGKQFHPRLTVIQKNTDIVFPNLDNVSHHVYSFSSAKRFEIPLFKGDPQAITFDKTGLVPVGCNIHDWMQAHILVVDSPYYGLTNAKGELILSVPQGSYKTIHWHPELAAPHLPVEGTLKVTEEAVNHPINVKTRFVPQTGRRVPGYE